MTRGGESLTRCLLVLVTGGGSLGQQEVPTSCGKPSRRRKHPRIQQNRCSRTVRTSSEGLGERRIGSLPPWTPWNLPFSWFGRERRAFCLLEARLLWSSTCSKCGKLLQRRMRMPVWYWPPERSGPGWMPKVDMWKFNCPVTLFYHWIFLPNSQITSL